MIALKDIPVYLSLAGTIFGGGVYINDLKRDVAELSSDYRTHVTQQQGTELRKERYQLEQRIKSSPSDEEAASRLREVEEDLEINRTQQQQLKGDK